MDSRKRNILISLMVAMFLGSVEGTVVTTTIPTIVKDLQGFEIISLVFSVYLLASAICTPILGQTIGVSVFGSIFNLYIVKYFTGIDLS